MASSKRQFAGRLFLGRQFEPSLWRGVGTSVEPLRITEIVGGWYIPGSRIGEAYEAGASPSVNGLSAQGFAAGAVTGEGRFE